VNVTAWAGGLEVTGDGTGPDVASSETVDAGQRLGVEQQQAGRCGWRVRWLPRCRARPQNVSSVQLHQTKKSFTRILCNYGIPHLRPTQVQGTSRPPGN
jgi:hypothetical protein